MIDFYQTDILTGASGKSNTLSDTNGVSATDPNGFRHKGTISLINDELASDSTRYLTAVVLRVQAGLTYTDLNVARTNLRKAWVTLNSDSDGSLKPANQQKGLTFDQMNYAIAHDGALQP